MPGEEMNSQTFGDLVSAYTDYKLIECSHAWVNAFIIYIISVCYEVYINIDSWWWWS